jgi:hypothetical protein
MNHSDFFMWGERGLVATFFADLHLWDDPKAFDSFLDKVQIDSHLFPRKTKKIMCIVEPDFGNAGFGHPDAVLRVEAENTASVVIIEAKRHPYVNACKPIHLRGISRSGFNSSLNGQLELDFALALALEQFAETDHELIEPEWITKTPYALERGQGVRRTLKNRNVLRDVVAKICGLPLEHYFFVALTTDSSNPFEEEHQGWILPELFHPKHGLDNCWNQIKHQFGWVNYVALKEVIESLFVGSTFEFDSLFLESLEINGKNMGRSTNIVSSGYEPTRRGTSIIYAPQINAKTYLHFSWRGENCALRDYSLSSTEEPYAERSFRTSDVRKLIEEEVPLTRREGVTNTSRMHQKIFELNKQLVL